MDPRQDSLSTAKQFHVHVLEGKGRLEIDELLPCLSDYFGNAVLETYRVHV